MWGRDCAIECITVTTADVQVGNKFGVQTNVKVIGLTTPAAVEGRKQTVLHYNHYKEHNTIHNLPPRVNNSGGRVSTLHRPV